MDEIDLKKIVEEFVVLEEMTASQDLVIVDDQDKEWIEDRSKSEVEFDDEQQQAYEQELTKHARPRVFERNGSGPRGDQCHDSGRRPREHEIHKG